MDAVILMFAYMLRRLFICFLRGLKPTSACTAGNNCGNHWKGENATYKYNNRNTWCLPGIFIFRFQMRRAISGMRNTREQINAIPWMPYKHWGFLGMGSPLVVKPYELCWSKSSGSCRNLNPALFRAALDLLKILGAVCSSLCMRLAVLLSLWDFCWKKTHPL